MLEMEQVANMLVAAKLGTLSKDVFVHRFPPTVNEGLLVLARLEGQEIDAGMGSYRRGPFQIVARSANVLTAQRKIRAAIPAVTFYGWRSLPPAGLASTPSRVLFIRVLSEPVIYPVSDGDLIEASADFEFGCA